jgi:uncharacterized membrane protein
VAEIERCTTKAFQKKKRTEFVESAPARSVASVGFEEVTRQICQDCCCYFQRIPEIVLLMTWPAAGVVLSQPADCCLRSAEIIAQS